MDMVRHLAQRQDTDPILERIYAKVRKIDQMVADGIEQEKPVHSILIAVGQDATEESSRFHSFCQVCYEGNAKLEENKQGQ